VCAENPDNALTIIGEEIGGKAYASGSRKGIPSRKATTISKLECGTKVPSFMKTLGAARKRSRSFGSHLHNLRVLVL
jgi:hypothetical protein